MIRILLGLIASVNCQLNKLTILHTNDVHSHYDVTNKYGTDCTPKQFTESMCWGGLARMKRAIDKKRKEHPNCLLLDGGDQFQGTLFYTYYNGTKTAEAMNYMGYDAMSLGNHEFDHGPQSLADAISSVEFPIVDVNVDASSVPDLAKKIKPYTLFPKYKVAIIGYLTPTAPYIAKTESVKVIDPIEPVQKAIDEVKKLGYSRIIGLSHHGYHEDMDLASKTRGLSLIVGGHSHTFLKPSGNLSETIGKGLESGGFYPTPVTNLDQKQTYVVQAGFWGRFLGHVDIEFGVDGYLSDIKGAPIELTMDLEEDEVIKKKVQQWRIPFDEYAKKVIGVTELDFTKTDCDKECHLGNLITDIILFHRPKSSVCIINSGGLRSGIAPGKITVGDIQTMLPFGDSIVDIELTGQRIWDILEASASGVNKADGKPVSTTIQVSGLQFKYNPKGPLQSRVIEVKIKTSTGYESIDLTKKYMVSTVDFVANGGDNLLNPPVKESPELMKTDESVMEYIKSHTPILKPTGPRIIIVNDPSTPSSSPSSTN